MNAASALAERSGAPCLASSSAISSFASVVSATYIVSQSLKVDLPKASLDEKVSPDRPPVTVAVQANGRVYWNDEPVSNDLLESRLAVLAQEVPQRQVDIRADDVTKYAVIAEVVKKARMAGIRKIGFVSNKER